MALQLRRGTDAERQAMTPAEGELIYVVDYDSVGTSPLWIGDGATAGGLNALAPLNIAANTATNLAGGATGSIPYQSASSSTSFIPIGAVGSILASDGTTATWQTLASLSSGAGVNADNVFVNTPTAGDRYIVLADDNGAYIAVEADKGATAPIYNIDSGLKVRSTLTVSGNIIPDTNGIYNIGGPGARFATLYLTTATIDLGGETLTAFSNVLYLNNTEIITTSTIGNYQSSTATNLAGGTAGQIAYQTGPGLTSFAGPGTAGQLLVSAGASAPVYTNTGSIYVGNAAMADSVNSANTATQQVGFAASAGSLLSTNTGSTQVGFAATAGELLSANTGSTYVGFANKSNNVVGGTAGQLVYQSGIDTTAFAGPGTAGQLLVSAGTSAPTYTNTGSIYVGNAATANVLNAGNTSTQQVGYSANLLAGSAGSIPYQSGANATTYLSIGTNGYVLSSNGSAPTWTALSGLSAGQATTATNLANGTAGQIPYQSSPGNTGFIGPGTAGQLLVSAGTSAPTYTNTGSIYVGNAAVANILNAGNTSTQQVGFAATAGQLLASNTSTQQVGYAANVLAGAAGSLVYQTGANATGMLAIGAAGTYLTSTGTAPQWSSTSSGQIGYAANVLAGAAGSLVYQSGANATAMLGISSTNGAILVSNGSTAPQYATWTTAFTTGTGSTSVATNQSLRVTGGGIGVVGDSYFKNNVGIDGTLNVIGAVTFSSPVTFNGTATYVLSTNTWYTDNILELHVPPGGVNTQWQADDGKDIGFRFHYYTASTDTNAALVLANDTKYLEWYGSGAEGTSTFVGSTYGTFKTGNLVLTGTAGTTNATSGAIQVAGGVGVGGNLYVAGIITATTFVGAMSGTATSANNITGGTAGQLVYQTGVGATSFAGPGTAGQILVSAGTSAPTYTNTGSIYVGNAATANVLNAGNTATQQVGYAANLLAGAAGGLPYQTAANATGMLSIGTANQLLTVNAGATAPQWSSTSTTLVGFAATAGAILAGNTGTTYVGFANKSNNVIGGTAGQLLYNSAADTTGFVGPGTAGQILVSAGASAPTYTNTGSIYVGNAATANVLNAGNTATQQVGYAANVLAGAAGSLHYQTGANATGMLAVGTAGQILTVNSGATAPQWSTTSTLQVGYSANLLAGAAGSVPYQSGANATGMLAIGAAGTYLTSSGTAPQWSTTSTGQIGYAANLLAGAAGSLPYQSGANATTQLSIGAANTILVSTGSAPSWVSTSSIYATKAANADKVDTVIATGNAVHYVTFVDSNNVTAATEINYTTSTFVVNPATGNVAIGTTSTTNKFQISGAYGQLFSVVDSFTGTVFAASDISGIPSIEVLDTGFVKIAQYGGTVAISTASTVTSSGSTMGLTVWTSTYLLSLGVGSTASGVVGEIRASNEITAYYSSDRRLKENVRLITDPITLVNQLNGVYFDWTDEHIERRGGEDGFFVRKDDVGVIAQEVEAVLPQLVADRPDGFKGVKYEKMIPLLIEAIKQQDKTINRLEEELREIKTRLSNLE